MAAGALPILLLGGAVLAAVAMSSGKASAAPASGGGALGPDGFELNMPLAYKQQAAFLLNEGMNPDELDAAAGAYASFGFLSTAERLHRKAEAIRASRPGPSPLPPPQAPPQAPPISVPTPGGGTSSGTRSTRGCTDLRD